MNDSDVGDLWLTVLRLVDSNRAITLALQAKKLILPDEYAEALEAARRETQELRADILRRFPPDGRPPETGGGRLH